jgi:hypothetical protein
MHCLGYCTYHHEVPSSARNSSAQTQTCPTPKSNGHYSLHTFYTRLWVRTDDGENDPRVTIFPWRGHYSPEVGLTRTLVLESA